MMSGVMALRRIHVIVQSVSSSMLCLQSTRWHALQSKLLSASVSCPTSGSCDTVLSSGYASIVGVPLPLLGMPTHLYLPAYLPKSVCAIRGQTCHSNLLMGRAPL